MAAIVARVLLEWAIASIGFNQHRLHSASGYVPPVEFEQLSHSPPARLEQGLKQQPGSSDILT